MDRFYNRADLLAFATSLLVKEGMTEDKADVVAELLVQTDELGVTTHGVSMIPYYIPELRSGNMTTTGEVTVLSDRPVAMVWDGNYLPGHWIMKQALDVCIDKAKASGMSAMAIRRSHHIGCLSTLTRIAADQGLICYIATSDPSGKWVAPYGGVDPVLTPNPWAVGYPAKDHPVLIDTCASITTVSKVREYVNSGRQFDHQWMLDGEGNPTTDPNVVNQTPKGTILPVGGADHGHKGFAQSLMVEMLTQALAGHGRVEAPTRWGANVFIQVIDPEAFGGLGAFTDQVEHLNALCRASRPAKGFTRVRVPGDRASEALAQVATKGVRIVDEVWTRLSAAALDAGVEMPEQRS